ncbi:aldo/keto reductase [Rhodococcus sp. NM-2]|uniref:aldo/keto reductase n=1 Tax=Rhodococcus sp. NM-2 TaxID=3401174 RepID=UPI003AAC6F3E
MNFGDATDKPASFEIMDTAIDNDINFFDSADVYGGPRYPDTEKGYGTSEEIIGEWLAKSGRRDEIVLATKVYQPMGLGPNDRRLSAYHIKRACEAAADRQHRPGQPRSRRPGRPWSNWSRRARSRMSAPATTPAGASPPRSSPASPGTSSVAGRIAATVAASGGRSRLCRPAGRRPSASW